MEAEVTFHHVEEGCGFGDIVVFFVMYKDVVAKILRPDKRWDPPARMGVKLAKCLNRRRIMGADGNDTCDRVAKSLVWNHKHAGEQLP